MPGERLPAGVHCDGSPIAMWAGPDIKHASNELDVWSHTSDGRIAHWWYRVDTNRWYGPEFFG